MGMGGNNGGGSTGGTSTGGTASGSRTFNYETNGLSVTARMNGNLNLANGGSVGTWYFGNGFSGNRQW